MHGAPAAILVAAATHLYPGARSRVADWTGAAGPCLLELSDGVTVLAEIADGGVLRVPEHVTASGTAIGGKAWQLEFGDGAFRVRRRIG